MRPMSKNMQRLIGHSSARKEMKTPGGILHLIQTCHWGKKNASTEYLRGGFLEIGDHHKDPAQTISLGPGQNYQFQVLMSSGSKGFVTSQLLRAKQLYTMRLPTTKAP